LQNYFKILFYFTRNHGDSGSGRNSATKRLCIF